MTDRELLEAAAKAAGMAVIRSRLDDPLQRDMLIDLRPDAQPRGWNPLTDDGDALRLAVALRIDLHFEDNGAIGRIVEAMSPELDDKPGTRWCMTESTDESDPAAATRRAITRAAAALSGDAGGGR